MSKPFFFQIRHREVQQKKTRIVVRFFYQKINTDLLFKPTGIRKPQTRRKLPLSLRRPHPFPLPPLVYPSPTVIFPKVKMSPERNEQKKRKIILRRQHCNTLSQTRRWFR